MKTKLFALVVLLIGAALVSTGCGSNAQASTDVAPEKVVESFYAPYAAFRADPSVEFDNPIASKSYRDSAYLSDGFVQKVDEIIASFDKGGYDPFLCAQDIPGEFRFDAAQVSDDGQTARVVMHEVWNPNTEYENVHDVDVALERVDGAWKISDVICQ